MPQIIRDVRGFALKGGMVSTSLKEDIYDKRKN